MLLYHGSKDRSITKFKIFNNRNNLDFGLGVYLTTKEWQARQWASPNGAIYVFDIDISGLKCIEYKDEDLNYVLYLCRIDLEDVARDTIDFFDDADIIMGPVLDGRTKGFEKIAEKFNEGDITYEDFEKRIELFDDKDQLCFKTQNAIDLLNKGFVQRIDIQ